MKKLKSSLLNMVLALTSVAVIMGGILAFVNHLTEGPIAAQKVKALNDGIGIVKACQWLKMENAPLEKIAGTDLFLYEMDRLERRGGVCFFMGSSPAVLARIREKAAEKYPSIRVETYSPPYKPEFSPEDNRAILEAIHERLAII